MNKKIPIAILGATGLVGQKAIALIESHPDFYVSEVAASESKEGKSYKESVVWREPGAIPKSVENLILKNPEEIASPYVFSAIPANIALQIEPYLTKKGLHLFSNASAFRQHKDVPLLIPEINLPHLELISRQKTKGKLITNSNCTTAFITLALAPLLKLSKIEHVSIMTMQAISGAGYPGVDSADILGNIIPHISGEEEKIASETKRILGSIDEPHPMEITSHVHRVPVMHGHTAVLHITFKDKVLVDEVFEAYKNGPHLGLYHVYKEVNRPQPVRDITPYDYSVHIGRIKQEGTKIGLISMGNNLVRGAAGACIKNLEAYLAETK